MPHAILSSTATDSFAGLLNGAPVSWRAFKMGRDEFLHESSEQDLTSLVAERLRSRPTELDDWPDDVCDALAMRARAQAAEELVRERELISVLAALASEGIRPILLKGTALAYSVYANPSLRPRVDTDLLIKRQEVNVVRRVMEDHGYAAPIHCEGELLFCQFQLKKIDAFGLQHTLDVHWKISTQPVFADVLGFDEMAAMAVDLRALGPYARTAGPLHALLLACIHPVMHHRNVESLIWIFDVHLLASRLCERELDDFADAAIDRQVAAVCAHQLNAARRRFGTRIPDAVMARLATAAGEASALYLQPNRSWGDELIASIRGLPRWQDRLRLVREVTLPGPAYMLKAYGLPSGPGTALLPVLYLHRLLAGGWKVVAGQK